MPSYSMRLGLLLGLLLLCSAAQAVPVAFEDHNGNQADNSPVFLHWILNPSRTWVFDLNNDALEVGNVEPQHNLLTAFLSIDVEDDRFPGIRIDIGTLSLDNQLVWIGEVDTGVQTLNVLGWVADHVLNVQICALIGDAWINSIVLHGTYDNGVPSGDDEPVVPEPATLALISLGLAGAGVLRRRRPGLQPTA